MLRRVSDLKGYQFQADDGRFGKFTDLLFDDVTWKARWIVADTHGWLTGRLVLLHPSVVGRPEDAQRLLPIKLTKALIEASPSVRADEPVSRQVENSLYVYYDSPAVWASTYPGGYGMSYPLTEQRSVRDPSWNQWYDNNNDMNEGDPHLRSAVAVTGYYIHATDGEVGHIESFLIDDDGWSVPYLVIDTRNWWQGDHVLVTSAAVASIDYSSRSIHLRVTREQVKAGLAWQAQTPPAAKAASIDLPDKVSG